MKHKKHLSYNICVIIILSILCFGCNNPSATSGGNPNSDKTLPITQQKELIQGQWQGGCTPDYERIPESIFHIGRKQAGGSINSFEIDNTGKAHILYNDVYSRNMYSFISNGEKFSLNEGKINSLDDNPYLDILNKESDSFKSKMQTSSKNRSHFVCWDKEGLIHLIWNGTGWETIDGAVPISELEETGASGSKVEFPTSYKDTDYKIQLILDSNDSPNIVFYKGHTYSEEMSYIHLIRWNGLKWVTIDAKKYDRDSNDGLIYTSKHSIGQIKLLLDSEDNSYLLWSEDNNDNKCIKGLKKSGKKLVRIEGPFINENHNIVDLTDKIVYSWWDFHTNIDKNDNLHLSWWYKDDEDSLIRHRYMMFDSSSSIWANINNEKVDKNYNNTDVPASIEHIDNRGYLHHIEYANDNADLAHTMWNGDQWISVEGRPVPPEGDEECIFYRNYNDRPPADFIIRTHDNNLYVMWHQWSQGGAVGVGVCTNIHYMEWIEDETQDDGQ